MPCPPAGDLPNPGIKPRSPTLQADSLPSEPTGKPMNTGVGSLSLLQRIFLTQELNKGFLHCRQIFYQLSYQGNPCSLAAAAAKSLQSCSTPCDPMDYTVHWNSPGQNIGVGSLSLLQGIFPTQGLNPGLPHCRRILYRLSHQGNPSFIPTLYLPFMIWRLAISVTYEMRDVCN